jgi:hypothetical protein
MGVYHKLRLLCYSGNVGFMCTISYEINFWNYMTFFSQARWTCGTTDFICPCTILHATGFELPPNFEDCKFTAKFKFSSVPVTRTSFDKRLNDWSIKNESKNSAEILRGRHCLRTRTFILFGLSFTCIKMWYYLSFVSCIVGPMLSWIIYTWNFFYRNFWTF